MSSPEVIWQAQPGPQKFLLRCPIGDVFFGGARGGGKTDGLLGDWMAHQYRHGGNAKGVIFRRSMPELEDVIHRSHEIYGPIGWRWLERKSKWTAPDGAELKMRFLDRDSDAAKYQGHKYTYVGFDELPHFPDPAPVDKIYATLRSPTGVPCLFRATGNPGGPGHVWVKNRYIAPHPKGLVPFDVERTNPLTGEILTHTRVFIPSKLQDNLLLMQNDPEYAARLAHSGDEELVKAWLAGDWDVAVGQYFTEFNHDVHVIPETSVPEHWTKFRAMDWGSKTPFCILWFAVSQGDAVVGGIKPPHGALVCYREWYGARRGNEGLSMTAREVAHGIFRREPEGSNAIDYSVADYEIRKHVNGPSVSEDFAGEGIYWRIADKERLPGWAQVRNRLKGKNYQQDDWQPMLYFMDCCEHTIRTLPAMIRDEKRLEDVLKSGEDHAPDTVRYACMSRPYVMQMPTTQKQRHELTLGPPPLHVRPEKERLIGY